VGGIGVAVVCRNPPARSKLGVFGACSRDECDKEQVTPPPVPHERETTVERIGLQVKGVRFQVGTRSTFFPSLFSVDYPSPSPNRSRGWGRRLGGGRICRRDLKIWIL